MFQKRVIFLCFTILNYYGSKPIIGILSNPDPEQSNDTPTSVLYLTYSLYGESLGAKILPLLYNYPLDELEKKMLLVDGVILQGGMRSLHHGQYETQAKNIIKIAEYNKIPIFFICQGLQLINFLLTNGEIEIEKFNSFGLQLPGIVVEENIKDSVMFKYFDTKQLEIFKTELSTIHFHDYGISQSEFDKFSVLNETLKITSYGMDKDNRLFISSLESKDFSKNKFFAVQFHPEKASFSKNPWENKYCTLSALLVSNLIGVAFSELVREHYEIKENKSDTYPELFITNESILGYDEKFYTFDIRADGNKLVTKIYREDPLIVLIAVILFLMLIVGLIFVIKVIDRNKKSDDTKRMNNGSSNTLLQV